MSFFTQQSSSRRKEKAPAERLTPLQEKELESADLRRQVRNFQREADEDRIKLEEFEAEQKAKLEVIDRLEKEISFYKKYNVQREDLFRKYCEEIRAADERHRLELADVRNITDKASSPVPLTASKKAETRERANPQIEQSGSHNHAEELEFQKTSKDATKEEFETVKDNKNKLAGGSGSNASTFARSLSSTDYFGPIFSDDQSNERIRAAVTISTQRPILSSAPNTNLSTVSGTGRGASGDRHGSKTLPSKQHTPAVPRSEDVGSLATPEEAESVRDHAQVAAEPTAPAFVVEGWTFHPGLSETRRGWMESLLSSAKKNSAKEDTEKEQKLVEPYGPSEHLTLGVDGSSMSRSIPSREMKPGNGLLQPTDNLIMSEQSSRRSDYLEEDGSVEATRESKQPDVESKKAKRSFSQSFSGPDLSQKKAKTDGR